jgi:hypothetical protein
MEVSISNLEGEESVECTFPQTMFFIIQNSTEKTRDI